MDNFSVVILAAGKGTRMKSSVQKVLHTIFGKSMISHIVGIVRGLSPDKILVVIGHQKEAVKNNLARDNVVFVEQLKPLGTGDAVKQTEKILKDYQGNILILCGDTPLLQTKTLKSLLKLHQREHAAATILTALLQNPFSYGRIKRNGNGEVEAIVEEADAQPEEKRIKEINSGVYLFSAPKLFRSLSLVKPNNVKGEYYLTDAIRLLCDSGERITAYLAEKSEEVLGVNTPADLEFARQILTARGEKR
ncbi:MAG: sugar phosphate nucleotidyltransferase [Candidatus Ratteibacteria bacterium]|jgi:bifunctional UDP-N-acetylglucosamine pyrophosphorylase/glucosamine-1-phosphate N-acetyltransferase